jgi:transposase
MSIQGVGYCCQIRGNMNGALYCQVLQSTLMRSVDYLDLDDNAPCHTSKNVLECLRELGITVLEWPPQSLDLDPIEHLWDHLKRQLAKYGTPASSAIDLWDRVLEEWWKIKDKTCLYLIDSLPNRIEAVINAKGGVTRF